MFFFKLFDSLSEENIMLDAFILIPIKYGLHLLDTSVYHALLLFLQLSMPLSNSLQLLNHALLKVLSYDDLLINLLSQAFIFYSQLINLRFQTISSRLMILNTLFQLIHFLF